jgi:signal transduction histidine kinase
MDSLSWFVSSGLAQLSGDKCSLPQHREYMVIRDKFYFSKDAISATGKKKEAYLRINFLIELSTQQYFRKDYLHSKLNLQEALDIATSNHIDYEELHKIRPAMNNNFFLAGDYSNAMKISSDGLTNAEKIKDTNRIIHFSNVIGYIHMKQRNFEEAGQYFNGELKLSRALKAVLEEAHALYNLADLAVARRQYDSAITFLNQSRTIYRNAVHLNVFNPLEREAFIANKIAEAYKLKNDLGHALEFSSISTNIATGESGLNEYDEASFYINAGDIYNRLYQPDSAILYCRKGLGIARKIIHREYIRDASEQLALAFAAKKIYDSAYWYHSLFARLKDSIASESNQQEILQREANLKIQQQKELQQVALEKQKLWRNIIIGIALFSLITLLFLYNRYRLRQKNRYQQQLNRQQNELFNAVAVAQDQERKRIAEDLHDSLGSILSAAKLKLSALKETQATGEDQQEKYQVAMQLLDDASAELRSISHNIMPATLSKLGLVAALRNLIGTISAHSALQVNFSAHDFTERIEEKTEMSIYRIVLELVNNSVKHAGASKLTVQLIKYPDYINLTVEDNGKGFDYENESQLKKGIGLGNIASRVNYLAGKMNVDSAPGRGTGVIIDIPYVTV